MTSAETIAGNAALAKGSTGEWAAFCDANPAVKHIETLLPDTNGVFRGKWIPRPEAGRLWGSGMALPRSIFALDIWGREVRDTKLHLETGDRDGTCRPVPGSLSLSNPAGTAAQVLMTMECDGEASWLDPRVQLARALNHMQQLGFNPVVAFELEFYLLDPETYAENRSLVPAQTAGVPLQNMYSLSDLEQVSGFLEDIRDQARLQRLSVDTMLSEAAPGQYEINLMHQADALRAADEAVLLRRLVMTAAKRHGMMATFMPKPFIDQPGSGMHVHVSLEGRDKKNAFGAEQGGPELLRSSVAGLLSTMAELTLLFVQSYNGFRRLQPDSYAPTRPSWGHDNRSVAVRIPAGNPSSRRVEHRISGADANPYLVLAALLHGMAAGIEQGQSPPEPVKDSAYDQTVSTLPVDLREAVSRFRNSEFAREHFGEEYVSLLGHVKAAEQRGFDKDITQLELDTYLV